MDVRVLRMCMRVCDSASILLLLLLLLLLQQQQLNLGTSATIKMPVKLIKRFVMFCLKVSPT